MSDQDATEHIIELFLTHTEIARLAMAAHERNMTLNDFIVQNAVEYAKELSSTEAEDE